MEQGTILDKDSIKKILVTRMQGMGDVVCFIPTLRELRRNFPDAKITILTGRSSGKDLAEDCPFVDEILFYDVDKKSGILEKARFIMSLRQKKFDLIIASSQEVGFALKAFLSGAKYRVGFKEYIINNVNSRDRFSFLNTISVVAGEQEHEIEANLKLLEVMNLEIKDSGLDIWIKEENIRYVKEMFERYHLTGKKIVAINTTSNRRVKNWPEDRYVTLLRYLVEKKDLRVILIGGADAIGLNRHISELVGDGLTDLTGKTTIGQLIALLSMCYLFIGNDSGPMNIAAAVGIPVVVLFGPGDRIRFRPYTSRCIVINKDVDCAPCNKQICDSMKCMRDITVGEVIEAIEYFISER